MHVCGTSERNIRHFFILHILLIHIIVHFIILHILIVHLLIVVVPFRRFLQGTRGPASSR